MSIAISNGRADGGDLRRVVNNWCKIAAEGPEGLFAGDGRSGFG